MGGGRKREGRQEDRRGRNEEEGGSGKVEVGRWMWEVEDGLSIFCL
jgi:hypothetical protein